MPSVRSRRPRARSRFTLIEVVVVVVLLLTAGGVAVVALKPESPHRKLERVALEFQHFCARARFQAIENGSDRAVVYVMDDDVFAMCDPLELDEATTPDTSNAMFRWRLPEDISLDADSLRLESDKAWLELFRFFPDGGACGLRKFILSYKDSGLVLEISALTGELRARERTEEDLL